MQKFKKILCCVLIVSIFLAALNITVSAEEKTANIIGANVAIRTEPNTGTSQVIIRVSNVSVKVLSSVEGEQVDKDSTNIWYKVKYGEYEGYVYGKYVSFPPSKDDYVYDENFEKNIENFPESYRDDLRALHSKYPNWKFVAHNIDISFKDAVESQYGVSDVKDTRKWVEFTYGGNEWRDMRAYDSEKDKWLTLETRWTYASRAAIEYYMDPRNSLDESKIFVFMQQSYQEDDKTIDNLRTVIKGTFLEKGYDKNSDGTVDADAYIEDIIDASKASKVSPYVLAATIIVEQGINGETNMVSGSYSGFENYYNFFNFGASGASTDEITVSALTFAKTEGWDSRNKAIVEGSKKYASGYISVGQDTYYYKDFNVVNQIWWHQYASALYDAWTNANYLKKGCLTNTDAVITFTIPVYKNMPESACASPGTAGVPEPTLPETPAPLPESTVKKGDTNGDDKINAVDLAAIKMSILGVKEFEDTAKKAADVNDDGSINAIDLAAVKMHILGIKPLS